jgi:4-amino-4-deoxy-L-arabinose transferase-like glycosyltransferase
MITAVLNRESLKSAAPYFLLGAVALGTLFFRLGALPFIGADECRYARIAQEMSESGRWVTPILTGLPWLEKPPLYYWITIPMIRTFGMSEAAARIAPALTALMAAASIFWLGARLWSWRAGAWSALILLTAIGYAAFGRSASMDMPFTACLTVAFALFAAGIFRGGSSWWQAACAYALIGCAVLAKGPVGIVLAAGILVLFWVFDEQGGSLRRIHVFAGAWITLLVSVPWFWLVFRENGFSFISIFFINHNLARYVSDLHHHDQPVYYFLLVLPGLLFPWSGWLPMLIPRPLRGRAVLNWRTWDRSTIFLLSWALFPLVFFSFSGSKLAGYVLPCLPPIALLLGRGVAGLTDQERSRDALRRTPWVCFVLSLLLAVACPVVFQIEYGGAWKVGMGLGIAVLGPALAALWFALRGRCVRALQATALQGLILLLAGILLSTGPLATYHSAREIAAMALAADTGKEPILTYYYFHHTLHYYTGYRVGANIINPAVLIDYARRHASFLVVTEYPQAQELQNMPQIRVSIVGSQGKLRLLRIRSAGQPPNG